MKVASRNQLYEWFKRGLKPLQEHFWEWIFSFWHKDDKIPATSIDGLQEALDDKLDKAELGTSIDDAKNELGEYVDEAVGSLTDDIRDVKDLVDTKYPDADGKALERRVGATEAALTAHEATNEQQFASVDTRQAEQDTAISRNAQDIEGIRQDIANKEHFRGYFAANAEIEALASPDAGDYAYSAESGTKWAYNGTAWENTGVSVPDQTVPASDATPLVNGTATPGVANEYARGDHRHPTDPTRAADAEVAKLAGNNRLTGNNTFAGKAAYESESYMPTDTGEFASKGYVDEATEHTVKFDSDNNIPLRADTQLLAEAGPDVHSVFGLLTDAVYTSLAQLPDGVEVTGKEIRFTDTEILPDFEGMGVAAINFEPEDTDLIYAVAAGKFNFDEAGERNFIFILSFDNEGNFNMVPIYDEFNGGWVKTSYIIPSDSKYVVSGNSLSEVATANWNFENALIDVRTYKVEVGTAGIPLRLETNEKVEVLTASGAVETVVLESDIEDLKTEPKFSGWKDAADVALGKNARTFTGSVGIGDGANANQSYTVAIGKEAGTAHRGSVAVGERSYAGGDTFNPSVAIGANARVDLNAGAGTAIGPNATVENSYGIAIGEGAQVQDSEHGHAGGIAIGNRAIVSGSGIQLGPGTNTTPGLQFRQYPVLSYTGEIVDERLGKNIARYAVFSTDVQAKFYSAANPTHIVISTEDA